MNVAEHADGGAAQMPGGGETRWTELVASALAAGERDEPRVRSHVDRALDLGATPGELLSVFRVALVLCGVPSLRSGIRALLAALAERGEIG